MYRRWASSSGDERVVVRAKTTSKYAAGIGVSAGSRVDYAVQQCRAAGSSYSCAGTYHVLRDASSRDLCMCVCVGVGVGGCGWVCVYAMRARSCLP